MRRVPRCRSTPRDRGSLCRAWRAGIRAARAFARGGVLLEVGPHRVLVGRDAGPEVIRAVVLVSQDLAAKRRAYVELDARFAGQVVVRRRATASGGGEGA